MDDLPDELNQVYYKWRLSQILGVKPSEVDDLAQSDINIAMFGTALDNALRKGR